MMMMMRKLILAFGVLFLTASGSHAAPITFQFTGFVDNVAEATFLGQGTNGSNVYDIVPVSSSARFPGSVFSVGESFSGTFTYETTASGSGVVSADGFQTDYFSALIAFSVAFDDYSIVLDTGGEPFSGLASVSVVNDRVLSGGYQPDAFFLRAAHSADGWFSNYSLPLIDLSGSVFQDMSLPLNLSLGDFYSGSLNVSFLELESQDQLQVTGQLTTLDLVPIPEPNTALLLGVGLLGLGVKRRRRQAILH